MAIDMNADIGDLLRNVFSSKKATGETTNRTTNEQNPYLKLVLIGVFLMLSTVLYVMFIFLPAQDDIKIKQEQIAQIGQLKSEIQILNDEILIAQSKLDADTIEFEELTTLFHTDQELEDLYRHISTLALTHQLLVARLAKADEEPVFDTAVNDQSDATNNNDGKTILKRVSFYKIRVMFEITGNYVRYTSFRRELAKLKKIVNIDDERITVLDSGEQKGGVKVSATLSTYRMPLSDEEKYISVDSLQ